MAKASMICCGVRQCVAVCCIVLQFISRRMGMATASIVRKIHCNTLQQSLQHTGTECVAVCCSGVVRNIPNPTLRLLPHTSIQIRNCNTLQHTAKHCNTLQESLLHRKAHHIPAIYVSQSHREAATLEFVAASRLHTPFFFPAKEHFHTPTHHPFTVDVPVTHVSQSCLEAATPQFLAASRSHTKIFFSAKRTVLTTL